MRLTQSRLKQTLIATIGAIGFFFYVASVGKAMDFTAAGAPQSMVQGRNYQSLFNELKRNGIGYFFPTFQYQEVPRPRSFGYETDFTAPCSASSAGFAALRASGVKLVLPAELVYPNASRIGKVSKERDPLSKLIACAGRDTIAAITNYDEAIFQGVKIGDVEKLYNRVKEIDPSLPVWMVHGPIVTDKSMFRTPGKRNNYLNSVVAYSQFSDVVGFDVYPVPETISLVATPLSNGKVVMVSRAIGDYASWLNTAVPGKAKLMVLQGFAYSDLYESNYLRQNVPANLLEEIHPPSRNELDMMVRQARDNGVGMVIWWGQAALKQSSQAPWPDILKMGRDY